MEQNEVFKLRLSSNIRQQLNDLAADAGVTAAEWLRQQIAEAWNAAKIADANPAEQD
jgi:predicted DNA-binding protein